MEILKAEHLTKLYGVGENQVKALDDVSFSVHKGEFLAIIGPSGSGKSTLMNMLGCLDIPTSGSYYLNGKDVSAMNDNQLSEIRNEEIGFIFQGFNLIANLNAIENVELPLIYRGIGRSERNRLAREALIKVGLEKRMHHRPSEMSGGQQQRIALARAILKPGELLLCDEPTGSLDPTNKEIIFRALEQLKEQGKTILIVSHDPYIIENSDIIYDIKSLSK